METTTSKQTTTSRPVTKRPAKRAGMNLALLGAAILQHFGRAARASVSPAAAEAALVGRTSLGYGAPPDVWGQSEACRRMVLKNRRALR